jgi:hypothetical protein
MQRRTVLQRLLATPLSWLWRRKIEKTGDHEEASSAARMTAERGANTLASNETAHYMADVSVPLRAADSEAGREIGLDTSGGILNVKDFGALGNGIRDDTTAVQATITAAERVAAGGVVVWFPPGTYKLSRLTITASGLTLRGAGRTATVLATGTTTAFLTLRQLTGVRIIGLTLRNTGKTGGTALSCAAVQHSAFEDLIIDGAWSVGILCTTVDSADFGSTIYNTFRHILITGLCANAVGLKMTELVGASDAKVVNANLFVHVVIGPNVNDGVTAVRILNANGRSSVNENVFVGGEWSGSGTTAGTGLSIANGAVRNFTAIGVTVENNKTTGVLIGSNGADQNEGVTLTGCVIGGNGTNSATDNFTDHSPAFRHTIRSTISNIVANWRSDPNGALGIYSLGLGGAAPRGLTNDINFGGTGTISVSGTAIAVTAANGVTFNGLGENLTSLTAANTPYDVLPTDAVILVNAAGGPVTVTLPRPAAFRTREYQIKKIDNSENAAMVVSAGAALIEGSLTQSLTAQYATIRVVSDGSNWFALVRT